MITEGSTSIEVKDEYVPVRAARINNTENDVVSGGDPIPPDGVQPGTYQLYWRYDPDGQSGLTGESWYGSSPNSLPAYLSMTEIEYNNTLFNIYTDQGIEAVQTKINEDFESWKNSGVRGEFIDDGWFNGVLLELRTNNCLRMV